MAKNESPAKSRLGPTFHRGFALNIPSIINILALSKDLGTHLTPKVLRERTTLGTIYIEAMPRYARGGGLLQSSNLGLTPLGEFVVEHNPDLSNLDTLWLMHYHLSAPLGPGAAYWHYLVGHHLVPGSKINTSTLRDNAQAIIKADDPDGKGLVDRHAQTIITVFTGTYTKEDALGPLGILTETSDGFVVQEPDPPSTWVVGYALAHYWQQKWPHLGQVNLEELYEPGGFASLLFLSNYALNRSLRELQRHQRLELWQVAPPYQLVKLWNSPNDFLPHLYS